MNEQQTYCLILLWVFFYCVVAFVLNTEFLCLLDSQSKTQSCLPLLVSMVGFEATHGDYQKVIKVIELLVEKYPTVAELWMLLIK